MMVDRWSDRLSEYLDGDLTPSEQQACATHISGCDPCRATIEDLSQIRQGLQTLPGLQPSRDLWNAIVPRLAPRRLKSVLGFRRRVTLPAWSLGMAAAVIAVVSAGTIWLVLQPTAPFDLGEGTTLPTDPIPAVAVLDRSVTPVIEELERLLADRRADLDPGIVEVIEANLDTIDRAIADISNALVTDPDNALLNHFLAGTMRRKLDLLQRVTSEVTLTI